MLREKKIGNGKVSLYLDIYHNGARSYEFLDIHITKSKPSSEDKEKRQLAKEIRAKRENELIVLDQGLIDKRRRLADFVAWLELFLRGKATNNQYSGALGNLKLFQGARRIKTLIEEKGIQLKRILYTGHKPLAFVHINREWINSFKAFLLSRVSNNSALGYINILKAGLNEAERIGIIQKNPFKLLEQKDKLRKKDIFRSAFSIDQLQMLADTPCEIEPQYRQLFFLSCFSGLRWSDVNCLKWSEIIVKCLHEREEWFIYFEQEKTEGIEYTPLSEQAIEILKAQQAEREATGEDDVYVFPLCKEIEGTKRVYNRVYYALKKWGRAARERFGDSCGITDRMMRAHTGRHTFATNVMENSEHGDLYTVQKLLGQKTWQAAQIYAHVRDSKKQAAVKDLPKINLRIVHTKAA